LNYFLYTFSLCALTVADQLMEDTAEFGREITQDSKAALLAHLPRGLTWPQIHGKYCYAPGSYK
jgi:hypothetical protein